MSKRDVRHPATGEVIGSFTETGVEQAGVIVEKSRNAFRSWSRTEMVERIDLLRKLRWYLVEHAEEVVENVCASTGKTPVDALVADLLTSVEMIKHLEQHARKYLQPQKVKTPLLFYGKQSYIEYKPRGIVLVISPWNYPFQLSIVPLVSALVGGNCVILKPSEVTPLVGVLLENVFQAVGFPRDVLQVAHGDGKLGAALVEQSPDYIFFTGSVATGKKIQRAAAEHLIPTTLELGGKDPMIVLEDAPLERAVNGALWGAYTNCGQVCMSVERLYVQESIAPRFLARLKEEARKLKVGHSVDDDIGSLTFRPQLDVLRRHLTDALEQGAKLESGSDTIGEGMRLEPFILTGVNQEMLVMKEESFGPFLPLQTFKTEEEAIRLANESPYGLNASVWSSDLQRAKRVASQLISGNVVINDVMVNVGNPYLPFGGVKQSGLGSYHGAEGVRMFCFQTSVMVDKGKKKREVNWFPYQNKYGLFKSVLQHYYGKKSNLVRVLKDYMRLERM